MDKIENFIGIYENAFNKEYCENTIRAFDELEEAMLNNALCPSGNCEA